VSPPTIESDEGEKQALLEAAKYMLVAARTAPKTAGVDDILTLTVYGEEKDTIAKQMERMAEEFRKD
jgi:uncharacterized ferredoxin-like protein